MNGRDGFTKEEKNRMLLSRETRLGLQITGKLLATRPLDSIYPHSDNIPHSSAFILGIGEVHFRHPRSKTLPEQQDLPRPA